MATALRQQKFRYSERELSNLKVVLSDDRLTQYLVISNNDLKKAIELYERNTELSEALYTPMQGVEIALRNSVHRVLTNDFASDAWYDGPRLVLLNQQADALAKAKANLTRQGKPHEPGRIVAELSFGFWVGLIGGGYGRVGLWNQHLHKAFPNARLRRRQAHSALNRIRLLRNRVAHHEPILSRDLRADHENLLKVAGWVCPDTQNWISKCSRFESVFGDGWLHRALRIFNRP